MIGNVADGANAVWYASEGKYLDAALSSAALIPGIGQMVTVAKPGIKAAAIGIVFKSVAEAVAWLRKHLEKLGIMKPGAGSTPYVTSIYSFRAGMMRVMRQGCDLTLCL